MKVRNKKFATTRMKMFKRTNGKFASYLLLAEETVQPGGNG